MESPPVTRAKVVPPSEKSEKDTFSFGPWTCSSQKCRILKSDGPERQEFESELDLPNLPEMIFARNYLRVEHQGGMGVEFKALDALRLVDSEHRGPRVAEAEEWLAARADSEHVKEVLKPYDWTFTSSYQGSVFAGGDNTSFQITETDERIDTEKLKQRDRIHFFADVVLYEDELHDSGTSVLSIKMRVMPSYFFILMRQFVRVDNVLIRLHDTRFYHQSGSNYILREHIWRESKVKDIKAPPHLHTDPTEICNFLEIREEQRHRLTIPDTCLPVNS